MAESNDVSVYPSRLYILEVDRIGGGAPDVWASRTRQQAEAIFRLLRRKAADPALLTDAPIATPRDAVNRIKAEVALKHGVSVGQLVGHTRTARVAAARFEAMARLRAETTQGAKSTIWIGRQFGGRDHSTVLNGLARHAERVAEGAVA